MALEFLVPDARHLENLVSLVREKIFVLKKLLLHSLAQQQRPTVDLRVLIVTHSHNTILLCTLADV